MDAETAKALRAVELALATQGQGLTLLLQAIDGQTKLIEEIHKACTDDRPASPLVEPLRQLIAVCQETAETVRDLVNTAEAQPAAVRDVVREELTKSPRWVG